MFFRLICRYCCIIEQISVYWLTIKPKILMKKTLVFVILFAIAGMQFGFSQTATNKDFFKGTWEVTVFGTPNGDSKMLVTLNRVDGKLTGELASTNDSSKVRYKIDKVTENEKSIVIYFYAEGMDINLSLTKEDENNLKGSLLDGMFASTGKRVVEKKSKDAH